MTRYFIKSISIEGFRGINNTGNPLIINFQSDGVTSIFGENGRGKSSIYEAFLFSILGRIIRFDDYHGDIKDKATIKNIFHSGDGSIKIEFIDNSKTVLDLSVRVNSKGERVVSSTSISNPEAFLSSLCSNLNFLDYKSFEKIMLTSSEETGKLFSNLVGFGGFNNIKDKLDKISRTQNINNDFGKSSKETIVKANNEKVSELYAEIQKKIKEIGIDKELSNVDDIFKVVKSFLKNLYSIKIKEKLINSKIDFDQLVRTKIGPTYEEDVSRLNAQQEALSDILIMLKGIVSFNMRTITTLKNKLKSAYSHIDTPNDIVFGKLFDDAIKSYDAVSSVDKDSCVLCSTEKLENKGDSFYQQLKSKVKSYYRFKEKYSSFLDEFLHKLRDSKIDVIGDKFFAEKDKFVFNVKNQDFLTIDYFETNNMVDIISVYKLKVRAEKYRIIASIKEIKRLIPPRVSELVDINNTYKFIFNSIVEIDNLTRESEYNTKYLVELEKWTSFTSKIKEDYEGAYNLLMERIASMIDTDTKLFFKEIMGDVDIIPKLKKEYRGQKVNILLEKFHSNNTDIKAATLLSESYRNALSLSIYFATAIKSKNPGCFIIVDDITSSFDSGHQLYLLDLIKKKICFSPANRTGKQIVFLTHDGLLKKVLNENNGLKNWTHYNLNASLNAVSIKPFKSDDLKLIIQEKILNGNYIGSDFRMYYEFILLEIIEKLNLEIPFSLINSHDEKMVGKLSNSIYEIIELKRSARRIRTISSRLPSKGDFKFHTMQLANNLSHWASGREASLAITVLNRIIDDIDNFKKLFQYNCTCVSGNFGWVYYRSLSSPRHKGCTCII